MKTLTASALLLIFHLFIVSDTLGQLNITASNNAQTLAQAIVGKGVIISNATFTGSAAGAGLFTNANPSDLGISKGILLTSGSATAVNGAASSFMGVNPGTLGDADLSALIKNAPTHNAVVLEFDFQAVGDSILVNFVFGSEEYPEYACSNFNDAFAFLISGPGYTGKQNIALVPNTTIPVAINSINAGAGSFGQIGTCNQLGPGSPFTNLYVDNTNNPRVAFDGYTKVLTARAKVTPCVTYHIKLAVADVSDGSFDSGVFIEGESFKSNIVTLSMDAFVNTTDGTFLVEGCKPGTLTMKRLCNDNGTQPLNLQLQVGGSATPNVDYKALPVNVTLAAGEFEKTFPIDVVNDFIPEGVENITIIVKNVNTGEFSNPTQILVRDQAVFHKTVDDYVCTIVGKTLAAQKVDTTTNTWLWSTGATTQTININAEGMYWVEHQFAQNCFNIDTFKIVNGDPIFNIGPDTLYCAYDSVRLAPSSAITPATYLWNTGQSSTSIHAKDQGIYWLQITKPNGCFQRDSMLAIHKVVPAITLGNDTSLCAYESFFTTAYFIGANYKWNDGSTDPVRLIDSAGVYFVENELNGCFFRDTITVIDKVMPIANAGDDVTIDRVNVVQLNAKQDPANISYKWTPNAYLSSSNIPNPVSFPLNDIMYALEVTSADGCVASDTMKIWIEDLLNVPNAFSPNGDGINDTWIIPLLETYPKAIIEIFNRFGKIVHRTVGYKTPWNGTTSGSPLPAGTYYYYINPNNGKKLKTGWVQILR